MTEPINHIEPTDTETVEKEGEKVTGGSDSDQTSGTEYESSGPETASNSELMPAEESKKEEMTGYNEHPDQEKVGGG